jgi:hypothetical protein
MKCYICRGEFLLSGYVLGIPRQELAKDHFPIGRCTLAEVAEGVVEKERARMDCRLGMQRSC